MIKYLLFLSAAVMLLASPAKAACIASNCNSTVGTSQGQVQGQHQTAVGVGVGIGVGQGGQGGQGGNASGQSNSQVTSFSDVKQVPAVLVSAPGLASLASSDCVLSNTSAVGGGIGLAMVGVSASYGEGSTKPYDECNKRAAIQLLGQLQGTIQGIPVTVIISNMAASLTGVQDAINAARPAPKKTASLPAVTAQVQTASLPSTRDPRCGFESPGTRWYVAHCQ